MRLLLDDYEKPELETRLKKSKDLSEWKRIFAIIGDDDGQSKEFFESVRHFRSPGWLII